MDPMFYVAILIAMAGFGFTQFLVDWFNRTSFGLLTREHTPRIEYQFTHDAFRSMYIPEGSEEPSFIIPNDPDCGHFALYSKEGLTIPAGKTSIIGTGVMFDIPVGYEIQINSRPGLAVKHGVNVLTAPGRYSDDYTAEIKVVLHNHDQNNYRVKPGDMIAEFALVYAPETPLFTQKKQVEENDGRETI